MDDIINYKYTYAHASNEPNYPSRLSELRSNHSILPSKPYTRGLPMRNGNENANSLESVDSLLSGNGPVSDEYESGRINDGRIDTSVGRVSKAQMTPNPVDQFNMKTRGIQLPVKHSNQEGTQVGILLPKYHVHPQSKCIMCRDCGIFFSHGSFLRHLHDSVGRRLECQSTMLELGVDNPGVHQMKVWEDFLAKLRGESSSKRLRTSIYDSTVSTASFDPSDMSEALSEGSRIHVADMHSARQPLPPQRPPTHCSPKTSLHAPRQSLTTLQTYPMSNPSNLQSGGSVRSHSSHLSLGTKFSSRNSYENANDHPRALSPQSSSISEFNRNIQRTVDASEILLKETSHFLASTDKSWHRRNRSTNLELHTEPLTGNSRPRASRTLFASGRLQTSSFDDHPVSDDQSSRGIQQIRDHRLALASSRSRLNPDFSGDQEATGGNGHSTACFPEDTRMFAGGDPPPPSNDPHKNREPLTNGKLLEGDIPIRDHSANANALTRLGPSNGIASRNVGQAAAAMNEDSSLRLNFPQVNGEARNPQDKQDMKKEDPLFILQTAQELLSLASHRIQIMSDEGTLVNRPPTSPGRDNEFLQLYHEERSKRRKFESQIQELQESLKEEQRQRKELEIQLRALKLQR